MRRATWSVLVAFHVLASAVWSQTAAEFSRADQLPLPGSGVWFREVASREECLCLSSRSGTVVFEGGFVSAKDGSGVPTRLVFADARTGAEAKSVELGSTVSEARTVREIMVPMMQKRGENRDRCPLCAARSMPWRAR